MSGAGQDITIVIADEHAMFRDVMRNLLGQEPGLVVVGDAGDGRDAVDAVHKLEPGLLLLSETLPSMSGLAVLQALHNDPVNTRKIIMSDKIETDLVVQALRLGAHGFFPKDASPSLLFKSIRTVMGGQYWVCHRCVAGLIQFLRDSHQLSIPQHGRGAPLSTRELQIAVAIVDGCTNKEIARKFSLSEQTVKHHLTNIFAKTGVSNRLELALFAMHSGLSA